MPPLPRSVRSSEPVLSQRIPAGDDWIHEIKHDGWRVLVTADEDGVRACTKSGRKCTDRFERVLKPLEKLRKRRVIIDGEMVVQDAHGVTRLAALNDAMRRGRLDNAVYIAFDLLFLDGVDLRSRPLVERKRALADLLKRVKGRILPSDYVTGSGSVLFTLICRLGAEGVVSKRMNSPYRSGRNRDWVKVKCPAWLARFKSSGAYASLRSRSPSRVR